jgi:hypothetical protein
MSEINPSPVSQTQTWAAIVTAIAGAFGAVLAKKRFSRSKAGVAPKPHDYITRTEFHQGLDAIRDRLDANHKDLLSAITALATAVEKRLDALESAIARLDERTRK